MSAADKVRREAFGRVMKHWLEYWQVADMPDIQKREYMSSFGGWPEKRLQAAFRKHKETGLRFPKEAQLFAADAELRKAAKLEKSASRKASAVDGSHREIAGAILHARQTGRHYGYEGTTLFPLEPLVTKALEIAAEIPCPANLEGNEKGLQHYRNSVAAGELDQMVIAELRAHAHARY